MKPQTGRHLDMGQVQGKLHPKHRAVQVSRTVILLLALISEIEHDFSFSLAPTAAELWTIFAASVPEANEVYEQRYAGFSPILAVQK